MLYNIVFMKKSGTTSWDLGLEQAKQHAADYIKIHKADRVEIRDDQGILVYHLENT